MWYGFTGSDKDFYGSIIRFVVVVDFAAVVVIVLLLLWFVKNRH